jgi:hypothetical protein
MPTAQFEPVFAIAIVVLYLSGWPSTGWIRLVTCQLWMNVVTPHHPKGTPPGPINVTEWYSKQRKLLTKQNHKVLIMASAVMPRWYSCLWPWNFKKKGSGFIPSFVLFLLLLRRTSSAGSNFFFFKESLVSVQRLLHFIRTFGYRLDSLHSKTLWFLFFTKEKL